MGTFHSFISPPLTRAEARKLHGEIVGIVINSNYSNADTGVKIEEARPGMWIVYGIIKNLGGPAFELLRATFPLVGISDENDLTLINTPDAAQTQKTK